MEEQPSIEKLLNIIKLQEAALIYYSDKKNYSGNIERMPILKDRGEQARFVLKQTEKINKFEEELVDEVNKALKDVEDINLDGFEAINNINYIKNILKNINSNKKDGD